MLRPLLSTSQSSADRQAESVTKILIVDDQQANLVVATTMLHGLPIEIDTARSGLEALTLVLRNEFAVILLDAQMPERDGYQTAMLIRDHTAKRPVPILFMEAGQPQEASIARGYEAGGIDFLHKPLQPLVLRSKVQVFIEMHRHRAQLADATRSFRETNQRLHRLLAAVGEGVIGIDSSGLVTLVNRAAATLLRASITQMQGRSVTTMLGLPALGDPTGPWAAAARDGMFRHDDSSFPDVEGRQFPVEYSLSAIDSDGSQQPSFVLVFKDISSRKAAEQRLRAQAEYDFLTGLSNRLVLERQLETLASRTARGGEGFAVVFIDLDGFKLINDTHGHAVGDLVLKEVGRRLVESMRSSDTCARLGGDEFAVVLPQVDAALDLQRISEKLSSCIGAPMRFDELELSVGASLGLARCPEHGTTVDAVLDAADRAMYRVKRSQQRVTAADPA